MDPMTDVLTVSGVRGTLGTRIEAGGSWAIALDDCPDAALHAVTSGGAWLTVAGRAPRELVAGDVVLLPAGTRHVLGDGPGAEAEPCDARAAARAREAGEVVRLGAPPVRTRIVTIHYGCDPAARTKVLGSLPDLVHVGRDAGSAHFDDTVRLLGRELADPGIATTAVLNSLVDIMLIQLLRAWLATRPTERLGTWLGMLGDPIVGRALERIHQDPARPWTTASLASAVAVSRATLSRHFPAAIGRSPAAYLTQWRMDLAARRLRDTHDSVEDIAAAVGYGSVPAFSRAFARDRGRTPGRYRVDSRERARDR
ncbi:AraC family transcriptional regulator [Streptomyces hainanensis]|uniref:AraC family transcriptional regulator n=1 Tax=Streptomyces hainanensis TaxID=402648 RepID=A0A4R4TDQ7_9ACTN|nr:AraC family transcriptional regulator [Streptomyces hainanensis]TDC75470.1 AraC family transcriptional regulator [Streptomyces hainanensis]